MASTILFTPAPPTSMGSRRTPRDFASGLVMALVLYIGFTRPGLDLQLPAGILGGIPL